MNTYIAVPTTNTSTKPFTIGWIMKAWELVKARIEVCPACAGPKLQGQRCGSCGHSERVTANEAKVALFPLDR